MITKKTFLRNKSHANSYCVWNGMVYIYKKNITYNLEAAFYNLD